MAVDYSRLTNDASPVEILEATEKLKTKKEKIEMLQRFGQRADFMYILRGAFAPNIELPYKGITKTLVAEAFPTIWPKESKASS